MEYACRFYPSLVPCCFCAHERKTQLQRLPQIISLRSVISPATHKRKSFHLFLYVKYIINSELVPDVCVASYPPMPEQRSDRLFGCTRRVSRIHVVRPTVHESRCSEPPLLTAATITFTLVWMMTASRLHTHTQKPAHGLNGRRTS